MYVLVTMQEIRITRMVAMGVQFSNPEINLVLDLLHHYFGDPLPIDYEPLTELGLVGIIIIFIVSMKHKE